DEAGAASGAYGSYGQVISNLCNSGTVDGNCVIAQRTPFGIGDTLAGNGSLTIVSGGALYNVVPALGTTGLTVSFPKGSVTVQSGGVVNANTQLTAASLVVAAGGSFIADGLGYPGGFQANGAGPGGGFGNYTAPETPVGGQGGGGGSYGGSGGAGSGAPY